MIAPINSAGTSPASASNSAQTYALTSDFETFLKMLTVQARNQDPLEPLDSSEYASQLAQFSMVEQQVQTNDLLSNLAGAMSVNLDQLTSWVGTQVQTSAACNFNGTPVDMTIDPDPTADKAELFVRNETGAVVDRVSVPTDRSGFSWSGQTKDGALPSGTYTASLENYRNKELVSETPVLVFSRVTEAQTTDDSILLTLDSGATIPVENVAQIRTGA